MSGLPSGHMESGPAAVALKDLWLCLSSSERRERQKSSVFFKECGSLADTKDLTYSFPKCSWMQALPAYPALITTVDTVSTQLNEKAWGCICLHRPRVSWRPRLASNLLCS